VGEATEEVRWGEMRREEEEGGKEGANENR
jgi:hypothetical protein